MKNINFYLACSLYMVFSNNIYSQNRDFDGLWTGNITTSEGNKVSLTLFIEDNNVYRVTEDEDGHKIKEMQYEVLWSKGYGEQLNFVWMNKGGIWTETQVYSLVWSKNNKLSLHYLRHVSNESDSHDGNTDWGYTATGSLYKN